MRKKNPKKIYEEKQPSHNKFKILEEEEGDEGMNQVTQNNQLEKENDERMEDRLVKSQQREDEPSYGTL